MTDARVPGASSNLPQRDPLWHFICPDCAKSEAIKTIGFVFQQVPEGCECCGQPITRDTAAPVKREHLEDLRRRTMPHFKIVVAGVEIDSRDAAEIETDKTVRSR
jgi:hypothetical protein